MDRKKKMKALKVIFYIGFVFFLILLLLTSNISLFFLPSDQKIQALVHDPSYPLAHQTYTWNEMEIEYYGVGNDTAQRVIMVHGSPGDWSNFYEIMKDSTLQRNYYMIAVNRIGYGQSDGLQGEPSLILQADMLKPLCVSSRGGDKPILVGHSMGGPIVVKAAADYGQQLQGVISVAGSFDPSLEPNEWYRGIYKVYPISLLFNRMLRSSNDELFLHRRELTLLAPEWERINCKVHIIQGGRDRLVHYKNFHYAKANLDPDIGSYEFIESEDHFIPFTNPGPVIQAIYQITEKQSRVLD